MSGHLEPVRLLARLGLSLAVLMVMLLGIEGLARLRQYVRYGTFGEIYEFTQDPDTGLAIPIAGRATESISINSLGFRGPELAPRSDDVVRLAFLGGSTTFCAEVSSNDATWPALVTAELARRFAPRRFDHVNGGVAAFTLSESLVNLTRRVGPLEPDIVVIYHASNDLTRNSRALAREQGVYHGHADRESWLARYSLAWSLVTKNLLARQRTEAVRRAEVAPLEVDLERLDAPFRRDLEGLVAAAQERARRVVLVTFAHRARPGQAAPQLLEACENSLYYMPYMTPQDLLESFRSYNRVIREVARATGCLLVEGEEAIPSDEEHFTDSIHMSDAGARALAAAVARGIAEDEALRELLASPAR